MEPGRAAYNRSNHIYDDSFILYVRFFVCFFGLPFRFFLFVFFYFFNLDGLCNVGIVEHMAIMFAVTFQWIDLFIYSFFNSCLQLCAVILFFTEIFSFHLPDPHPSSPCSPSFIFCLSSTHVLKVSRVSDECSRNQRNTFKVLTWPMLDWGRAAPAVCKICSPAAHPTVLSLPPKPRRQNHQRWLSV